MFDPKTPLQAGLIFCGGIAVIAWTILDVRRVTLQNDQPLTKQQRETLQAMGTEARKKADGVLDGKPVPAKHFRMPFRTYA